MRKEYSQRVGELVIGVVKKVMREGAILDLGDNAEAYYPARRNDSA